MGFGDTTSGKALREGFKSGVTAGVSGFQLMERERIDKEKTETLLREKRRKENLQADALKRAMGLDPLRPDPSEFDPVTKEPIRDAGRVFHEVDRGFTEDPSRVPSTTGTRFDVGTTPIEEREPWRRPNPTEEALLISQMSPEGRTAYKEFVKREDPSLSDSYFGVKEQMHPDGTGGGLYGYDKKTGEQVLIQDNPNYQFKPKTGGSYIIYGTADLNGKDIGKTGRRTRVVEMENGTFKLQDMGKIPSGSKGTKDELEKLEFEVKMSGFQSNADNLKRRRDTYNTKQWEGGESSREDFRVGYNSQMNHYAMESLNLGSDLAKEYGMKIYNDAKEMIRHMDEGAIATHGDILSNMERNTFFDVYKDEILDNVHTNRELKSGDGKWSYQDAQALIKFIEFKFENYLFQEGSQDSDDLFGNFEIDADGNVVQTNKENK
jgi:hypothetical protein